MDREVLISQLNILLEDYLKSLNLILVDIIYRYEGRDLVLRILTDKLTGGITLDECAILNRDIGGLLDEKDIIQGRYILEISSPGLDRPLKTKNDFLRCLNKSARFFLNELINGKLEWEGLINKVGEDSVFISVEDNLIEVPFLKINKARLII
ncbi:MAG: ribosome maturation factor RimP [Candidatus Omnitrophica bacterium CG08_land_8_20_14_0_20_41_16]|uniref:Ribosome maturation factor RimP n=1 Tax=Candidatus Sherwoodlollariibacterium unditelluris TaxID=1974757 RepID=A0A2G9YKJ7_9BACT|nr:MAG: ribosome maturation factor RimP [Candidatus Omnitrophica bacterium CG23_combo_of_CG06-09_8_20_14_all_41_10]PIS33732.1 MAG: ribosome maturation factor RimP [Candidatus Omnitrophica bacterium CG08_land_8_20_14_0_20_41_16]